MTKKIFCKPVADLNASLPFEEYEDYLKALKSDDVDTVTELLDQAGEKKIDAMLNGTFQFAQDTFVKKSDSTRFSKPLVVAVVAGSLAVVQVLFDRRCDVFQCNSNRENILHAVVLANYLEILSTERAMKIYKIVVSLVETPVLQKLLLSENSGGLRPVELAANLGCVSLYETIHLTPDVYVMKTKNLGFYKEE